MSKKARRSSKKSKKTPKTLKTRTPTPYPRIFTSRSYMNVTETYKNGQGRRNIVAIRNGHGEKRVELLGSQGEVLKTQKRILTGPEKEQILQGQFIPGLWRNCKLC